jgi:hypothetical protein
MPACKLLILESHWQHTPTQAPTETRSSARLYMSLCADGALRRPLDNAWQQVLYDFVHLPENQRGVNCVIISTHASVDTFATLEGTATFASLAAQSGILRRTVVLLDMCHAGIHTTQLCAATDALGVIGFAGAVDWTASGVLVMALLRQWQRDGVFALRRCSAVRPRLGIEQLAHSRYHSLIQHLQLRYCFKK